MEKVLFQDSEEQSPVEARTVSSFQVNEAYIGFYQGAREVDTPNGKGTIYSFVDSDDYGQDLGEVTEIWKSAGLDLARHNIIPGTLIQVIYQGMKQNANTGRKFGAFKVLKADKYTLLKD